MNENENVNVVRQPVKEIKDKKAYNRFRDRKDKKLYEEDMMEETEQND
jgi:hypothetical protein